MRSLLVFCLLWPFASIGQDTVMFFQKSAVMYSDIYLFYRENPEDDHGTFKHEIWTDDAQEWHGKGSFVEHKKKHVLTYEQHFDTLSVRIGIDSTKVSDSVLFLNSTITGGWAMLRIHYAYSIFSPLHNFNDIVTWYDSVFEIKSQFLYNMFWLNFDTNHLYCLPNTDRLIIVNIEYNAPNRVHLLTPASKEVLRKNKKGFKVKALFSNKRKEQFVPLIR